MQFSVMEYDRNDVKQSSNEVSQPCLMLELRLPGPTTDWQQRGHVIMFSRRLSIRQNDVRNDYRSNDGKGEMK